MPNLKIKKNINNLPEDADEIILLEEIKNTDLNVESLLKYLDIT